MSSEDSAPDRSERARHFVDELLNDPEFNEISAVLRERTGVDLGRYKDSGIRRRIIRRMRKLGFGDASSYIRQIRRKPDEADALLGYLTIHVSRFFRNPSTFDLLRKRVLPELFAASPAARGLKVWSVGCAQGEEPYSMALMLREGAPDGLRFSVLGTDVSESILERAREGTFSPEQLSEVPSEMRLRYFLQEGGRFRIQKEIRRLVRFRRHDLLTGPYFPEADLILCRNVLIYFSPEARDQALARMAESLSPGGFLVLGRAEALLGKVRDLFETVSVTERIYRRLPSTSG